MLRPGLQLLRPPKRDARDGPGVVAGFVAYNTDAFREEFGIEPWQVRWTLHTCLFAPALKQSVLSNSWLITLVAICTARAQDKLKC